MKDREEKFSLEIEQKRAEWIREQNEHEQARKERDVELKRSRQREKEKLNHDTNGHED